jgi:hypothetical protein
MKDTLGTLRDFTFIVAIYAFFTGFVYRYYYLDRLGIPVSYDDKSIFSIFVYSYTVAQDAWMGLIHNAVPITPLGIVVRILEAVAMLCTFFVAYAYRDKTKALLNAAPLILIIPTALLALFSFPILATIAQSAAINDADILRSPASSAKTAAVTLTESARRSYDTDFVNFIRNAYSIQLISQTTDAYYFLQVDNSSKSTQHAFVFAIPREHIARIDTLLFDITKTKLLQEIHP